jgi:hypothetical protein
MVRRWFLLAIWVLSLAAPDAADAQNREAARAGYLPWSGYWWPHKDGGLSRPLGKYDLVHKTQAGPWEVTNHPVAGAQDWFGFCHAWAASAVCEREPRAARAVADVRFNVGDQKALLAALHAEDVSNTYGDRYAEGGNLADIAPDELWKVLQMYVRSQRLPIVLDIEAGPEVWNYPIYQYSVQLQKLGGRKYAGTMQLVAADNNVRPDYIGTQYTLHDYTFEIELSNGAIVAGSGRWTGGSVTNHPDFCWYPYVSVPENPYVSPEQVGKIVGYAVGNGSTPPEVGPATPPQPPPVTVDPPVQPLPPGPEIPTETMLSVVDVAQSVVNQTSSFVVDVIAEGAYSEGAAVPIMVVTHSPGHLYLIDVHRDSGAMRLIYPTKNEDNRLEAGKLYKFPDANNPTLLRAANPGLHDLKAIVSAKPLQLTGFRPGGAAQGEDKSEVVEPSELYVNPSLRRYIENYLAKELGPEKGMPPKPPGKIAQFGMDRSVYTVLKGKAPAQQQSGGRDFSKGAKSP